MKYSIGQRIGATSAIIWLGTALWIVLGILVGMDEGIVYGTLFIIAGVLGGWDEARKQAPTEREQITVEEGLVPLRWARVAYICALGVIALYGLYVVRDESGFLVLFFAVYAASKTLTRSSEPDGETRNGADDTQGRNPPQRSAVSVEGESVGATPVLTEGQTAGVGLTVGILVYAVGWLVVIPAAFEGTTRPSDSALTVVTVIAAVVAHGLTNYVLDEWVSVIVDRDRLTERLETAEEYRAYRVVRRHWFEILVAIVSVSLVLIEGLS